MDMGRLRRAAGFASAFAVAGVSAAAPGRAAGAPPPAVPGYDPITVPLRAHPTNPRYFADGSGRAVYLTGSQTWNTFQDWGTHGTVQPVDFDAFVRMLRSHNHNFTFLWSTELPTFHGLPYAATSPEDITVSPLPWQRTGPGLATDGKLKFDVTKFNQAYFDRLRDRVHRLCEARIYAGCYFFTGEWLNIFRSPVDGYPLSAANNVNGVDDGGGTGAATMTAPNAVTDVQDAYVRRVIDTLNDQPNVLWIVSEEAPADARWWNSHLIAVARSYEARKPLQHPIGLATTMSLDDADLVTSDADWIAPSARISLPAGHAGGHPPFKVYVNDSDHSYWEMWNDPPQTNRNYFWINFTGGGQTVFMDPYVLYYPRQGRNLSPSPANGISASPDARWDNVRDTMGFIRSYALRMDLAGMTPRGDLASTGHALANTSAGRAEMLVYSPSGGALDVDLSGIKGTLSVEWMDPATGARTPGKPVRGGGILSLGPPFPFGRDAVLYLKEADGGPP
jgi:hypothetical protein